MLFLVFLFENKLNTICEYSIQIICKELIFFEICKHFVEKLLGKFEYILRKFQLLDFLNLSHLQMIGIEGGNRRICRID